MWKHITTILFISGYPYISESVTYKFQKTAKSFEESKVYCTTKFDGLAHIYNAEQQQALSRVVDGTAWIGVSKCGGNWCYTGSNRRVSYTNWAAGEPNNYGFFTNGEEYCVEMLSSHKWNDENCSDKNYFVCQELRCTATTCNGRGTCSELVNGFKCNCERGYYGYKCENVRCTATTCNGRGTCSELVDGFKCNCERGYYGDKCENVRCTATTCNGRGTCSELVDGFKCNCERGYYGDKCENVRCTATTCNRRGTCSDLVNGFKCNCERGYYGDKCENVKICPHLVKPNNSAVKCDGLHGENYFQSVCTFTCNQGFILKGNNSITCQAFGLWTTYNTVCKAQGAVNHHKLITILITVGAGAVILSIISVIIWRRWRNRQEQANSTNDPSSPAPQVMSICSSSELYCDMQWDTIYDNVPNLYQNLNVKRMK